MSMARVVITAVVVEGRSKSEVARDYGVSRRWVQKLVARYAQEGEAAFEPHSRRPHSNPRRISQPVEDAIIALRKSLRDHRAAKVAVRGRSRRRRGDHRLAPAATPAAAGRCRPRRLLTRR